MQNKLCHFDGDCEFRSKCSCNGNNELRCHTTHQISGVNFIDKQSHPTCIAKSYFGNAHICLCPAIANNF